jgi:hypothetical protein
MSDDVFSSFLCLGPAPRISIPRRKMQIMGKNFGNGVRIRSNPAASS